MKLKSLPNFPPKVDYGKEECIRDAYKDGKQEGYNQALTEVGELDIPVPSYLDIEHELIKAGLTDVDVNSQLAQAIHNLITKRGKK